MNGKSFAANNIWNGIIAVKLIDREWENLRNYMEEKMDHLDELEAEAIYIMREVAAECEKPDRKSVV